MRSAVVLLVVFAVCWAQEAPKPCCFPKQYEGNVSGHRPGSVMEASLRISIDASAKKVAVTVIDNRGLPVKMITDYAAGKEYIIREKNCTVHKTEIPFPPSCIPSTAKYAGPFFQGAGSDKLNQEAWTFNEMGPGTSVVISVTRSKCVPVEGLVMGKAEIVTIQRFRNVTLGIKDPNVFKPPASCKGVQEEDHFLGEEYQLLGYLRMKHTP